MNEFTFYIVRIIIAAATTSITMYLIPVLKSLVENLKDERLKKTIDTMVKAVEQTIKGDKVGPVKKDEVMKIMTDWITKKGYKITDQQLELLIEESVYILNHPESE